MHAGRVGGTICVMDYHEIAAWWDEAQDAEVWWAPWARAVDGLTAEQASWRPAPGRHSIWELVNHMTFWREYFVKRNTGAEPLSMEEVDRLNWQTPPVINDEAWAAARQRFLDSHARVRETMTGTPGPEPPKPQLNLRYLLFHDCYHVGQIMYIRALLGLEALES